MSWNKRIKLKHLFCASDDPKELAASCKAIGDAIKRDKSLEELHEIADELCALDEGTKRLKAVANAALSDIYDWADANRVWIE